MNSCGIKGKSALVLTQQAPKYAVKSIHTMNNYIIRFRRCQELFSERSELILRGGENYP